MFLFGFAFRLEWLAVVDVIIGAARCVALIVTKPSVCKNMDSN